MRAGRPVSPAAGAPGQAGASRAVSPLLPAGASEPRRWGSSGVVRDLAVAGPGPRHNVVSFRLSLQQEKAQGEEKEKRRG